MGFFPVTLRQMILDVPILVNRASLMNQILSILLFQALNDAAATVCDEQNILAQLQTPAFQVRQKRLT